MIRNVEYNGHTIEYNLERKKVKRINIRVNQDLSVNVSANPRVSLKFIDSVVIEKAPFILSSIDAFKNKTTLSIPNFSVQEFYKYVTDCFEKVYSLFLCENIEKPQLKFRKMKSCWGNCNYIKGIITINKNMIYCTEEQIYYVMVHEFAHLIEHNHSKAFYKIVEKYCKDYLRIINSKSITFKVLNNKK